jgi:asparagine synthase (glutamine-hydrolysing)
VSGLAAAFRFDGGPAPSDPFEKLIAAAPHRAPDGVTRWAGAGAALAKLHRLVLPGQQTFAQPFVHHESSWVVVFDGRLDSAVEDAAHVAEAIARTEDRAIDTLEGDFAIVAWNARARRLIAARDHLGNRPLHWTGHAGTLLVASDIAQLIAALPAVPPPDASAVSDLLAFEPAADQRTLYRGVSRVPPGHVMIADGRGVRLREYWRPEPGPADERRSDDDYADECRALLRRAVAARMRATTPVLVFFSGGIDSSSVLATAVDVARDRGFPPPRPTTMVFDEPESDERRFRQAFFEKHPLSPVEVPPGVIDGAGYRAQAAQRRVLPDMPSEFIGRPLFRRAKAIGARVGLTGAGGDFLFTGTTHAYADLLRRGRLGAALARVRQDRDDPEWGWTPGMIATGGLWPLLPRWLRGALRRPARVLAGIPDGPAWLRLPRADRPAVPDPPPGVSHASWDVCWGIRSGWTSVFIESGERGAAEDGVEPRHPLWDPALVAFALRLPERQRRRGMTTKYVLRRAADLPTAIDRRSTKADFGHVIERTFEALGGRRFFEALAVAEAGWVDAASACREYDLIRTHSALTDMRAASLLPRLWMLAAVELWYRAAYGGTGESGG